MQSDLWSEEDQQRLKSIFKLAARVCTCHSGKRLSDVLRPHHLCVLVPVLLQPPHWQPARFHQGKRGCSRAVDQIQWYTINTLNQILFLKSLMFLPKKRHLYDSTYYPLSCQAPQHHKEHTDCTISTSKDCILSSKARRFFCTASSSLLNSCQSRRNNHEETSCEGFLLKSFHLLWISFIQK